MFFEGGYFATDHDFLGPIRYQGRTGPVEEMPTEQVFDRYVEIAGLEGGEVDLARAGMYEDYAFLRCVEEGRPAFPDFRTALAAHEVVEACYRSAREGQEFGVAEV